MNNISRRKLTTRAGLSWCVLHDDPSFISSFVSVRIADEVCFKNTDNDANSTYPTVTITRAEHDILVKKAREFGMHTNYTMRNFFWASKTR